MFDASPFAEKVNKLVRELEKTEAELQFWKNKCEQQVAFDVARPSSSSGDGAEVRYWKDQYARAFDEAEKNSTAAQVKYDELKAQCVQLEDRLKDSEKESKKVSEEHAAYELFVRRSGGTPISRVRKLVVKCIAYGRRSGHDPRVFDEMVSDLRRMAEFYKIILDRYPQLAELIADRAGPSNTAVAVQYPSAPVRPPLIRSSYTGARGRGRSVLRGGRSGGRAQGGSRGGVQGRSRTTGVRGRGRGAAGSFNINVLDGILQADFGDIDEVPIEETEAEEEAPLGFYDRWLNCSRNRDPSSSS